MSFGQESRLVLVSSIMAFDMFEVISLYRFPLLDHSMLAVLCFTCMPKNEEQIICLYIHIQVCKNQIYVKYVGSLL